MQQTLLALNNIFQLLSFKNVRKCIHRKRTTFKNLSRALEDGGTLTSVFVPWNTCGVFILATLGVGAFEYAPYAILNFIVPIISIIYGITGFTIVKLSDIEKAELLKKQKAQLEA